MTKCTDSIKSYSTDKFVAPAYFYFGVGKLPHIYSSNGQVWLSGVDSTGRALIASSRFRSLGN